MKVSPILVVFGALAIAVLASSASAVDSDRPVDTVGNASDKCRAAVRRAFKAGTKSGATVSFKKGVAAGVRQGFKTGATIGFRIGARRGFRAGLRKGIKAGKTAGTGKLPPKAVFREALSARIQHRPSGIKVQVKENIVEKLRKRTTKKAMRKRTTKKAMRKRTTKKAMRSDAGTIDKSQLKNKREGRKEKVAEKIEASIIDGQGN